MSEVVKQAFEIRCSYSRGKALVFCFYCNDERFFPNVGKEGGEHNLPCSCCSASKCNQDFNKTKTLESKHDA